MNIKDRFAGAFFNADHVRAAKTLTIDDINVEEVGGEEKVVMSFRECEERLVCNKTNAMTIAEEWGDETDDWIGGTIQLSRGATMMKGKRVPCVQVQCVKRSPGLEAV
jgi:hypothetical protein